MRLVRIAPARQLALFAGEDGFSARWDGLPEQVQARVLALLAKMTADTGSAHPDDPGRTRPRRPSPGTARQPWQTDSTELLSKIEGDVAIP